MAIKTNPEIALNFLALSNQNLKIQFYRRKILESESKKRITDPNIRRYKVPIDPSNDDSKYEEYYISSEIIDDHEFTEIEIHHNPYLAKYILFRKLLSTCQKKLSNDVFLTTERFRHYVSFVICEDEIGKETVWLEPYFLYATKQIGFLVGYHFKVPDDTTITKSILIKSLSLSSNGRENKNYYHDQYKKIDVFLSKFRNKLFPIHFKVGESSDVIWPPELLQADSLETKTYIFSNDKGSHSQFQGIRNFGPLKTINENSLICFMYRPDDKPLSYELYHALRGKRFATFSGMKSMFSFSLGKEHVTGIPIKGYEKDNINEAIAKLVSISESRPVIPLILFPWSRSKPDILGQDTYYRIKHQFLEKRIPTQFVSLDRMRDRDGLKWSIANIALAVFSKLGGEPWKLLPKNKRCIIVGIGQAHQKNEKNEISRFFAYSVLTDSSGLYDSIRILSKSDKKDKYLNGLSDSLKIVLEDLSKNYDSFVIHTPFKLRFDEMDAIKRALQKFDSENSNKFSLIAIKFNEKSKYFGFALKNNSKIPYESSCINLGKKEYLVWFEGLQYHNPTVRRRISRPMHIDFFYSNKDITRDEEIYYLQDAINLSGANWRGFNAKSLPVSVYYAKIIADFIGHFDRLKLEEIDIENLPPWFL